MKTHAKASVKHAFIGSFQCDPHFQGHFTEPLRRFWDFWDFWNVWNVWNSPFCSSQADAAALHGPTQRTGNVCLLLVATEMHSHRAARHNTDTPLSSNEASTASHFATVVVPRSLDSLTRDAVSGLVVLARLAVAMVPLSSRIPASRGTTNHS